MINEKFYYTSARDTGNFSKKVHTWTGASFTSIYEADVKDLHEKDNVKRSLKGEVKTKLNESSAINNRRKAMYFTRNNMVKGKRRFDPTKIPNLKFSVQN